MLSKRLQCIADYIEPGSRVVDVGTDHGYIPVWLICNNVCSSVIASDINAGPLKKAEQNAEKNGVRNAIKFLLCPGLEGCNPDEVDTIIISGMGGETVIGILEKSPWALSKTLIIQPQTKLVELRSWMSRNGYVVKDASLVDDSGRIYVVLKVSAGECSKLTEARLYVDDSLISKCDPLLESYNENLIKKINFKISGLERATVADTSAIEQSRKTLAELIEIRKVYTNA